MIKVGNGGPERIILLDTKSIEVYKGFPIPSQYLFEHL